MDPITGAIVAALASGALSGATEVGKNAIVDAYEALKTALKKKSADKNDVVEAVDKLEQKPKSEARRDLVAEEIDDANLSGDPELAKLAQALLDALESTDQVAKEGGKYIVQGGNIEIVIQGDNTHIEGGFYM